MIQFIGYLAAFLTTISFLPQTIKTWKSKDTKSISLPMYFFLNIGLICWLIYGFMNGAIPLILANFISFIFAFPVLLLKLKYK